MLEHGEGTPRELRRLQDRLRSDKPELAVAFALAHKAKREGDLAQAEQLYRKAVEAGRGASYQSLAAVHNNLGNALLLQGDAQRAVAEYQKAMDLQDDLAAPHFNLGRAYALGGVDSLEKVQAEQARALELDRDAIDVFTGGQLAVSRRSNKFLLDAPLDDSMLAPLVDAEARLAAPVDEEVRAILAGPPPGCRSWRRSRSSGCMRCATASARAAAASAAAARCASAATATPVLPRRSARSA